MAPVGGGFEHIHGLAESFGEAVRSGPVPTDVVAPKMPPVMGAVLLALEQCQVNLDQVLPLLLEQTSS